MKTAGLLVEAARRAEVGEVELAARVLDALAEDVQGAAPVEFAGEAVQEALADIGAVVLLEAVPGAWLGRYEEVDDVAGDEAEVAVVVGVGGAAVVAAGGEAVAVWGAGGSWARPSRSGQASGPQRRRAHSMASSKARSEVGAGVMGWGGGGGVGRRVGVETVAHVDLSGDGGGDQGGAVFVEVGDGVVCLRGDLVNRGGLAV